MSDRFAVKLLVVKPATLDDAFLLDGVGEGVDFEIRECRYLSEWEITAIPDGDGLWVFEGDVVITEYGYPEPREVDVEHYGAWRRPYAVEMYRIGRGVSVFQEAPSDD